MTTKILHVLYLHQCDWCGKKKRTKLPVPDGWIKTQSRSIHSGELFCKEACQSASAQERQMQQLVLLKEQYPELVNDLTINPSERKPPRRYKNILNTEESLGIIGKRNGG